MHTDLTAIKAALADISETELTALVARRNEWCPASRVWPDGLDRGIRDWELNRRVGHDYELLPPEAAIDPSEDAVSIDAAIAMRATFAQNSPAVLALFDALVDQLTGSGRKQ